MSGRNRFRGKAVFSGGIVGQRRVFQEKVDSTSPASPVAGGGGGGGGSSGGLQWSYDHDDTARANARVWLNNNQTPTWTIGGYDTIYLGNATGAESITYSATGLPSGLSIDSASGALTGSASTVGYNQVTVTASDGSSSITKTVYVVQRSQQLFDTPGTYTITIPNYVDKVHAVLVGGGGAGSYGPITPGYNNSGGAGGGLRWIQELPVTGGETLNVYVGDRGQAASRTDVANPGPYYYGTPGGDSKITRGSGGSESILIWAGGGEGSPSPTYTIAVGMVAGGGGTPLGNKVDGSRVGGGDGGHTRNGSGFGGSGGGAGGYLGPGGMGRTSSAMPNTYPWPAWPTTLQPIYGELKDVFTAAPTDTRAGDSPGGGGTGGGNNGTSISPGGGGVGLYGYTGKGGKWPTNTVAYYPGLASPITIPSAVFDNGGDPYDYNTSPSFAPRRNDAIHAFGGSGGMNVRQRPAPVWGPLGVPSAIWQNPAQFTFPSIGGDFGGGGGGTRPQNPFTDYVRGARGGVRIIWGSDREWIGAKNTEDL